MGKSWNVSEIVDNGKGERLLQDFRRRRENLAGGTLALRILPKNAQIASAMALFLVNKRFTIKIKFFIKNILTIDKY